MFRVLIVEVSSGRGVSIAALLCMVNSEACLVKRQNMVFLDEPQRENFTNYCGEWKIVCLVFEIRLSPFRVLRQSNVRS